MPKDFSAFDNSPVKGIHYRWTTLAAIGDYLDAGSIVAGAASTTFWVSYFHLSSFLLGLIASLSPNAFAAFIGALIAGPLGDRYGRKTIYTYDLLIYIIGAIIITASTSVYMLVPGYILVGLAVGIDVPTSWALIAEYSPKMGRAKLMSFTNIFWYIGPIVILVLGIITSPLGVNSFRILFGSLAIVAIVTYILRRSLIESPRWAAVKGQEEQLKKAESALGINQTTTSSSPGASLPQTAQKVSLGRYAKGFAFIIPVYILWGIPAGTFGFFLPFLVAAIGASKSPVVGDLVDIGWFSTAIIGILLVPMRLGDKISRRLLYLISAVVCAIGFAIPTILPFRILAVALANAILFGFGQGMGLWPITRMWSVELFPTEIRNTAQGIVWSLMRFSLGVWSLFVLGIINALSYAGVAGLFAAFFVIAAILGGLYGPRAEGKTLEEVLMDFYGFV
ncbi:MFS transporter [Stygiolobus caldivivus]|uniref:Minor myo-inositol transporter IolF n=1 Tax=Stygiolobus caldivivus TaxID=2824673 RepID=A0A8D5U8G1_9CREN|nr:MFS transporter [Stygiolobus caldivivus]BCU71546.1 minor myo-inositol transporter IolF [Stygiolobus caldivivus]